MPELVKFNGLEVNELAYIIQRLARHGSLNLVKEEFESFFKKEIDGKLIQIICVEYSEKIQEKRKEYLDSPEEHPSSSLNIRLQRYEEIYKLAMEERIFAISKSGDPVTKIDLGTALKAIEAAARDIYNNRTLKLNEKKIKEISSINRETQSEEKKFQFKVITNEE